MTRPLSRRPRPGRGFTLVEMMVGLALGVLVIAAASAAFLSASSSRREIERAGRQIEAGRYAMALISDDLVNAGYFGEFDPRPVGLPAAKPDPCTVKVDDLRASVLLHVQAYTGSEARPSCVSDVRDGTSVLAIRRVATCVAGTANCDAVDGTNLYFQSTLCNVELANPVLATRYVLAVGGSASFALTKRDCTTAADLRRQVVHLYFIANNNRDGDGVPTLKRAELGKDSFTIVPLVEGIEDLRVQFGLDNDGNSTPDAMVEAPGKYNGCADADACYNANWSNAVVARVNLLSRATETTPGYAEARTYQLGLQDDGKPLEVGPFGDAYKRHAYSSMIRMHNPAGRRE